MSTVYIAQWLCPSRHAIIAVPWENDFITREEIEADGNEALRKMFGDTVKCDLCKSTDIHIEHGKSAIQNFEATVVMCMASGAKQQIDRQRYKQYRDSRRN